MLVLTRKVGERILIGENIWISIEKISPKKVWIGIDAPPNIGIKRHELILNVADRPEPVTDLRSLNTPAVVI